MEMAHPLSSQTISTHPSTFHLNSPTLDDDRDWQPASSDFLQALREGPPIPNRSTSHGPGDTKASVWGNIRSKLSATPPSSSTFNPYDAPSALPHSERLTTNTSPRLPQLSAFSRNLLGRNSSTTNVPLLPISRPNTRRRVSSRDAAMDAPRSHSPHPAQGAVGLGMDIAPKAPLTMVDRQRLNDIEGKRASSVGSMKSNFSRKGDMGDRLEGESEAEMKRREKESVFVWQAWVKQTINSQSYLNETSRSSNPVIILPTHDYAPPASRIVPVPQTPSLGSSSATSSVPYSFPPAADSPTANSSIATSTVPPFPSKVNAEAPLPDRSSRASLATVKLQKEGRGVPITVPRNPFLGLRTKAGGKVVRGLLLELAHNIACLVDGMSGGAKAEENAFVPLGLRQTSSILTRIRQRRTQTDGAELDIGWYTFEVGATIADLDEAIGIGSRVARGAASVARIFEEGGYDLNVLVLPWVNNGQGGGDKRWDGEVIQGRGLLQLLLDLEELLWGVEEMPEGEVDAYEL